MAHPGFPDPPSPSRPLRRRVLLSVGALGVSCVTTQLVLMRELLCAFAGNELVLGAILGNWLLLMGLGAGLTRTACQVARPATAFLWGQVLVAMLPPIQIFALRALRDTVFVRGAEVGIIGSSLGSLVLLAPFCLVAGALLPLACNMASGDTLGGQRPPGMAQVYVADGLGSVAGGAVFGLILVWWLDPFALVGLPAILNLSCAAALAARLGQKGSLVTTLALAAALGIGLCRGNWDALSASLQHREQEVLFRGQSPYGRLVVTRSAGQFNFIENGVPLFSTDSPEAEEEAVHYAMAQRPDASRVLLLSGGASGTAREILRYGVRELTYVELDPMILTAGRRFMPESLSDPRIKVVATDGRRYVQQAREQFDVVIVNMPDPSTSQINRFYTAEFFREVKSVLAPQGVLGFACGRYENYINTQLAQMLASAHRTLRETFVNALVLPVARVSFLGSDGPLHSDVAARIEQQGIHTRFVNRHYLDATLTPDRLADIQRAIAQPAAVNRDFNPVLYFQHCTRWLSQFPVHTRAWAVLPLVVLAVYLSRLTPPTLTVFTGGFAASTLEVVLLLVLQTLCGSVYQMMGMVVTAFMGGLVLGAWTADRSLRHLRTSGLAALAAGIASFAALLPLMLVPISALNRSGSVGWVEASLGLLTFVLASLVGMEFPLAGGLATPGTLGHGARRVFAADFIGASLGAFVAGGLLIPIWGVTALCLLTAGLNTVACVAMLARTNRL